MDIFTWIQLAKSSGELNLKILNFQIERNLHMDST